MCVVFIYFCREEHDALICFDARTVRWIADYAEVHLQRLEDAGKNQSTNLQANSGLEGILSKHCFFVQSKITL